MKNQKSEIRKQKSIQPNSVKRGAFDRMKKIFGLLQDGKYPNCTSLATEFEISLKTAARDIEFMRDRWNLPIGYDERMSEPTVMSKRFVRPKDFDPKKEFSTSIGVMRGTGDYQVVVEMDAWLTDILRGRRLHPSQVVEEFPGGGSRLRLRLGCLEEIEQHILSWGAHASVVEPRELRERLGKVAGELAARYADVKRDA